MTPRRTGRTGRSPVRAASCVWVSGSGWGSGFGRAGARRASRSVPARTSRWRLRPWRWGVADRIAARPSHRRPAAPRPGRPRGRVRRRRGQRPRSPSRCWGDRGGHRGRGRERRDPGGRAAGTQPRRPAWALTRWPRSGRRHAARHERWWQGVIGAAGGCRGRRRGGRLGRRRDHDDRRRAGSVIGGHDRGERGRHRHARRIAVAGLGGEGASDDGLQRRRDAGDAGARGRRRGADADQGDGVGRVPGPGPLPGQGLVEDEPEAVDVRRGRRRQAAGLLWGEVVDASRASCRAAPPRRRWRAGRSRSRRPSPGRRRRAGCCRA